MAKTYISLFSSAGVGCYGFKEEDFDCIATNELVDRRMNIQKINNKCKYNTGYIHGDITDIKTKEMLYSEVDFWKKNELIKDVDVIIATPPCQGMSVANHKKKDGEIKRNSLVIESLNIIKNVKPKFFVLENVSAFLKTICTDNDGYDKSIKEAISDNLETNYSIHSEVLNFKNYGSNSSRTRTIVIGVRSDLSSVITPMELFPDFQEERTLEDVIGHLPSLELFNEFSENDFYHSFRSYAPHMRSWITDLLEGESAFNNEDPMKRPHQVKNGVIVQNKNKNGDKYTRQRWNYIAPCIHTRNDQLASQNTIHPTDDRVFSIRELMLMMTIPNSFKWINKDLHELNTLTVEQKISLLKKNEINIRQSIGEAVPTAVFNSIARKMSLFLDNEHLKQKDISSIVEEEQLASFSNLMAYLENNKDRIYQTSLSNLIEYSNAERTKNSAFYTDKIILQEIYKYLPDFPNSKESIHILEPSVGSGNFLPIIFKKYEHLPKVTLDLIDIDEKSLEALKVIIKKYNPPKNLVIRYYLSDYLDFDSENKYDLIIGNPPFSKITTDYINKLKLDEEDFNLSSRNTASYFLEKSIKIADNVLMIMPKNLLNSTEFEKTRNLLVKKSSVDSLIDFGEKGFKGVLIETIAVVVNTEIRLQTTNVKSLTLKWEKTQLKSYIFDNSLPYWIIYRDEEFDRIFNSMNMGIFNVFRDRQITNKILKKSGRLRVLKSRNISNNGNEIIDIEGYDAYVDEDDVKHYSVYKYLNCDNIYMTPNMTYNSRLMKKPKSVLVNGSIALLTLNKEDIIFTTEDESYISSEEFRGFLKVARNYQTRTLNIDSNSVYFFGKRRI